MNKKLEFRLLRASEIECRAKANKGGVILLLYKDARCDQNILDEAVGPMNWERSHSRDNQNCTVSIWDEEKKIWVSKEDTGTESEMEAEKGLASDSFKRACFNWGIGRELYSAKNLNIFISKDKLKHFSITEDGKYLCFDGFKVIDIAYDETSRTISSITIAITEWGKEYDRVTFDNTIIKDNTSSLNVSDVNDKNTNDEFMSDDEVILIGNCKGKKYGDVKDTPLFNAFLKWVKSSGTSYPEKNKNIQMEKFKKLALEV